MVRKDPAQHASTVPEGGAFGNDRCGHGIVPTNTDTHEHSHAEQIPELIPRRAGHVVWQANDQYDTHHHDDHLFPVDESPAKSIAEESKRQLTNDIANVGGRVDGATKEKRVGRSLDGWLGEASPIFVGPYRGDQVDDEEIVRVEEESDTIHGCQLVVIGWLTRCICISPADGE